MINQEVCPFKIGDVVIFTHKWGKAGIPGERGLPRIGERIKISAITDGVYIGWDGMDTFLGKGVHWVEFSSLETNAAD